MNKIYIGDQEINTGGGSGGGGVTDASFNELAKVTASALIDLKGLEDNIEEFDDKIEGHVEAIDTQIQTLDANKPDSSVVYTKKDIDKADKVTAAALAELNDRVSTLESSSGTDYSEDILDVSNRVDFLGNLTLDVSARVDALEMLDYVDTSTLDASLNEFTYSKERIDASLAEIAAASGGSETPIPSNILQYFEVSETGFFFVDASMNIGVSIDSSGLHAPNLVEYNEIS